VEQLSAEEIEAFKRLADSCTDGNRICASAKSGVYVQKAVHMIIELVLFLIVNYLSKT